MEEIQLNINEPSTPRSVNFGSGAELLMNDKRAVKVGVDLGELDNIEKELNELSGHNTPTSGGGGAFRLNSVSPPPLTTHNLGQSTVESTSGVNSTWDGFFKMGEQPASVASNNPMMEPIPPQRKINRNSKKRELIRKIEQWYKNGLIDSMPNFSDETSFEEVEDEFEILISEKRRKESVKVYQSWFVTFVNTLEFLNASTDVTGMNLDGWAEQIKDDISSYEDIFAELHEKYKERKIAPELSLIMRLVTSAVIVNFSNRMLSSYSNMGIDSILQQSPELKNVFSKATSDALGKQSPMMNFMNDMAGSAAAPPPPQQRSAPPPPPMETQGPRAPPPPQRPGALPPRSRPDLGAVMTHGQSQQQQSQPLMFKETGVNIMEPQERINKGGIEIPQEKSSLRPEMNGPSSSLDGILSNLKIKTVDIKDSKENDSLMSISSLKELQQNSKIPPSGNKGSGRRGRKAAGDDGVTISLGQL